MMWKDRDVTIVKIDMLVSEQEKHTKKTPKVNKKDLNKMSHGS